MGARKKRPFSDPPRANTSNGELAQARAARRQSTAEYLRTVDRNLEVRQVTERLRKRREENHFGDLLRAAGWQPR